MLWSLPAHSKSSSRATQDRTMFRTLGDAHSVETYPSKLHASETKDGVLPVVLPMQSSSSISLGHLQTVDFSSQHFLKLGAPLLFPPGQLSAKPETFPTMGVGHLFSPLPGVNNQENGGLSSQSITSLSPFMFHLPQHMLKSQVCFRPICCNIPQQTHC